MKHIYQAIIVLIMWILMPFAFIKAQSMEKRQIIIGKVMDKEDMKAIPFATVSISYLEGDKEEIYGQVCDAGGTFKISLPLKQTYLVKLSFVGKKFKPIEVHPQIGRGKLDLGNLMMEDDESTNLEELKVVHKKPIIKMEIDRLAYNMSEDLEARTKDLLTMMRKVPMVTIDAQGNIQVRGTSNFRIYLNGKPSSMIEQDPKTVLKSIPASTIKKIEVITDPGVKYDAEGVDAIINIVTSQSMGDGLVGSVSTDIGYPWNFGHSINLAFKKNKLGVTLNLSRNYSPRNSENRLDLDMEVMDKSTGLKTHELTKVEQKVSSFWGNLLLSYELDSLNLVTLGGRIRQAKFTSYSNSHKEASDQSVIDLNQVQKSTYGGSNVSLDYQHSTKRKGELLTMSYQFEYTPNNMENSRVYDIPSTPNRFSQKGDAYMGVNTFQLDYVLPFCNVNKIETGAKYINRYSKSDPSYSYYDESEEAWVPNNNHSVDRLRHSFDIFAVYGVYTYSRKGFSFNAGIRGEWSNLKVKHLQTEGSKLTKNYFDWIPSVRVSYNIGQTQQVILNYNFKVRRPSIYQLDPYYDQMSEVFSIVGNPDLEPSKMHSVGLTYRLNLPTFMLSVNPSYSFTNDMISQYVKNGQSDISKITATFGNLGKEREANLSLYASWSLAKWVSCQFNLSGSYNHTSSDMLHRSVKSFGGYGYGALTFTLPNNWMIYANAGFSKQTEDLSSKKDFNFWDSYSISKSFFNDALNINLSINQPFTKYITRRTDVYSESSTIIGYNTNRARSVSVGISYRFGKMNSRVKQVSRSIVNDDLDTSKGGL